MNQIFKFLLLIFLAFVPAVIAQEKVTAVIDQTNSVQETDTIFFKISNQLILSSGIIIPDNSTIMVQILDIQDARRWHKSAYLVSKLITYKTGAQETAINVEDKDIYLVIRKYETLDKKQASKTAAEIGVTTAASFMIPGIDIAYYFTKGMIKKEEGKTRFKSGVSSAYENSIFWFWLKGKTIDLDENAVIKLVEVNKDKAMKLKSDIEKRKENQEKREQKKKHLKNL